MEIKISKLDFNYLNLSLDSFCGLGSFFDKKKEMIHFLSACAIEKFRSAP